MPETLLSPPATPQNEATNSPDPPEEDNASYKPPETNQEAPPNPNTSPSQSSEDLLSFMQAQREALGLAPTREDDPRWVTAYNDAYVAPKPAARYGEDRMYGDWHDQDARRYDAEAKANEGAAREAADAALRATDPNAYEGYDRYAEYSAPIVDPAFYDSFPPGIEDRDVPVAKIDNWVTEHPEKAGLYRFRIEDMREAAVQGAFDRGEPIPDADEQRLQARRRLSEMPLDQTPEHEDSQTGPNNLDWFGALVKGNPDLYGLVNAAENPQGALSFLHDHIDEYSVLLTADMAHAQSTGSALKDKLQAQRAAALRTRDTAAAYQAELQIALVDALLQERTVARRQDVILAA